MNTIPLINGQQYGWSNIQCQINGTLVTGITSINYDDSVAKENHYGAGNMPVHRGYGKYEAKASVTLYMNEVQAILASLNPGKRLQDIAPFSIEVSYLDDSSNNVITDTIRNCEFTTNSIGVNQGDTTISKALDLIVSHVEWGQ